MSDALPNEKKGMSKEAKIGIGLALVALVFAIYTYINPRSDQKQPVYSVENTGIISKTQIAVPDLKVTYKNNPVKLLTSTNVRFWNAGKRAIRSNDIYPEQPLCIPIPKGVNIMSCDSIKETRANAAPKLTIKDTPTGKNIVVSFYCLDSKDGFWIQILHDGTTDTKWKVTGTIFESQPISVLREYKTSPFAPMLIPICSMVMWGLIFSVGDIKILGKRYQYYSAYVGIFITGFYIAYTLYMLIAHGSTTSSIPPQIR